jgi:hypothetical protein
VSNITIGINVLK